MVVLTAQAPGAQDGVGTAVGAGDILASVGAAAGVWDGVSAGAVGALNGILCGGPILFALGIPTVVIARTGIGLPTAIVPISIRIPRRVATILTGIRRPSHV